MFSVVVLEAVLRQVLGYSTFTYTDRVPHRLLVSDEELLYALNHCQ